MRRIDPRQRIGGGFSEALSDAALHANRAATLIRGERFEDAVAACHAALAADAACADALHNLGVAQHSLGRMAAAEDAFRKAIAVHPRAATWASYGDLLRIGGRLCAAADAYRNALALDDEHLGAHANLGLMLAELGDFESGLRHAERAMDLAPENTSIRLGLGKALLEYGRVNDAMDLFAEVLERNPDLPRACLLNGQGWQELGNEVEAARWCERALRLDPKLVEARVRLAEICAEAGDPEEAAKRFQSVLDEEPGRVDARAGLARALLEQGDAEGAVDSFQKAIERAPERANLRAGLGHTLMNAGDLDAAIESFRTALQHGPTCASAWSGLLTTLRGKASDEEIAQAEAILQRPSLTDGRRAALLFGLAQALDGRGDFDGAGARLVDANAAQKSHFEERDRGYDLAAHSESVDRLIAAFDEGFVGRTSGFGLETSRPVFIVGMPRSGTTLTEQIIASHPQAYGAGERRYGSLGFHYLPAAMKRNAPPVECLADLTAEAVRAVGEWHLSQLDSLDGGKSARIIDKMPDNYHYLVWLATVFPNAALIHCRRDPRDVALSCWITHFASINWANDLDHLADRILQYERLMNRWRALLGPRLLEVDYEETVSDLEGTARRLLGHVGLDWDPRCLEFHRTERLVRTASVAQVRQPIYKRSVARWKRYEKYLKPLLEKLEQPKE